MFGQQTTLSLQLSTEKECQSENYEMLLHPTDEEILACMKEIWCEMDKIHNSATINISNVQTGQAKQYNLSTEGMSFIGANVIKEDMTQKVKR